MADGKKTRLPFFALLGNGAGVNTFNLDASGDRYAIVFDAETSDAITHLLFRYGSRTGTPPTYRISLQSVSLTDGTPTGTILGGGTPASATFTPPANASWDSTVQAIALSNSFTPTRGTAYAMVVDYSSGTINASNFSSFATGWVNVALTRQWLPYSLSDASVGTYSKNANEYPAWGYKTAGSVYGFPLKSLTTSQQIGTNGNRLAAKFTLPSGWGSTFQINRVVINGEAPAASGSVILGIWNAAGTALQDSTIDSDIAAANSSVTREFTKSFDSDALAALNYGTAYYIGLERVTVLVGIGYAEVQDVTHWDAFADGQNIALSTWNGSAWSDVTTQRPLIDIQFEDITPPAGGGSRGVIIGS